MRNQFRINTPVPIFRDGYSNSCTYVAYILKFKEQIELLHIKILVDGMKNGGIID